MGRKSKKLTKGGLRPTMLSGTDIKFKPTFVLLLIAITFLAYYPTLQNGFVNWDDNVYITENPDVKTLSLDNTKKFFTKAYNNTYVPLTMQTWAVEYTLVGEKPFLYLLNNLILHILCVLLVLKISRFFFANEKLCFLVAAIFALHPVHVESVSWITERKDVLYAFFFFLALLYYLKDIHRTKASRRYYRYSLFFFVLSLLSKGQAVTLAPILVLVDLFFKKDWLTKKNVLEKVPFFALSLLFGLLAMHFQSVFEGARVTYEFSLFDRFFIACMAFVKYVVSTIFPVNLSPVYPLPSSLEPLPAIFYVSALVVPVMLALSYWAYKKNKLAFVGFGVYVLAIVLMLDHSRIGLAISADRFLYVSVFGFGMVVAALAGYLSTKVKPSLVWLLCAVALLLSGIKTNSQTRVWKDDITLFGTAIRLYPENPVAYSGYGTALSDAKEYQEAIEAFNKGIELFPAFANLYINRGYTYSQMKRPEKAVVDQTTALKLAPNHAVALANRGWAYFLLEDYPKALEDFNKSLAKKPEFINALNGLGATYSEMKEYQKADQVFRRALAIDRNNSFVFTYSGINYLNQEKIDLALQSFNRAVALNPENSTALTFRAELKGRYLNDLTGAMKDLETAISLDELNYVAYNNMALVYFNLNQPEKMEGLFKKCLAIKPDYCEALVNYTVFLLQNKRRDEALHVYDRAMDYNCNQLPPELLR